VQDLYNTRVLKVVDLTFTYAGSDRAAIEGITLSAGAGRHTLIMGPTGAGKTTLCCALRGLLGTVIDGVVTGEIEAAGTVVLGRDRTSLQGTGSPVARLAPVVGLVFQDFESQLFSTTIRREVAFGPENLNMPPAETRRRVDWALDVVGLSGMEDRNPQSLSGGEKQRLAIASVLALRPRVLILDEPTTDLDPDGKQQVFALRERLAGEVDLLVMVEHEIEPALGFECLHLLSDGRLSASGDRSLLFDHRLFEQHAVQPYEPAVVAAEAGLASYDESALRVLLAGLPPPPPRPRPPSPPREALRLSGITAGYEGAPVLSDFSLVVGEGEFVAILGRNGCGKTTAAMTMAGLRRPRAGRVEILGEDPYAEGAGCAASRIGFVFQNPDHQIHANTISDEIAFGPRNLGLTESDVQARVSEVAKVVGLEDLLAADPFTLPKGYRQMVAVASVLAMKPRILVLDEPTTGLDLAGQRAILRLLADLNASGHTIIIITHSMRAALESATRAIVMEHGRIFLDGTVEDVFYDPELARTALRPPPIVALGRMAGVRVRSLAEILDLLRQSGRLRRMPA